jgi:acyl-CoA reductase-like NAD-dependent aldehyde dehydrogenase
MKFDWHVLNRQTRVKVDQIINEAMQIAKYYCRAREVQQVRMILYKVRQLIRVDRTRLGLVELKNSPTTRSARTDNSILRRLRVLSATSRTN